MSSPFQETTLSALVVLQSTKYAELSGAFLIVYDHLLTLRDEVAFVWNGRLSFGKALFLLIRYHNLFVVCFHISVLFNTNPSNSLCNLWFQWQAVLGIIIFSLTQVVLQMRIHAMYGANRGVLIAMITFFLLSIIATGILLGIDTKYSDYDSMALPGLIQGKMCFGVKRWGAYYSFWIPIICYEAFLFCLALYKGYEEMKQGLFQCGSSMLIKLVWDSSIYFFAIFATYLMTLLIFILSPNLAELPVTFVVAIPTIMSERILLNIYMFSRPSHSSFNLAHTWPLPHHPSSGLSGALTLALGDLNDEEAGPQF